MHCQNFLNRPTNRRDMLKWCANGFGAVALSALSAAKVGAHSKHRSNGTETAALPTQSEECDLFIHGRGPLSGGHF